MNSKQLEASFGFVKDEAVGAAKTLLKGIVTASIEYSKQRSNSVFCSHQVTFPHMIKNVTQVQLFMHLFKLI